MDLNDYRLAVIDSVWCTACGAGKSWPCLKLPEIKLPVNYVHDDRSFAHFKMIAKES